MRSRYTNIAWSTVACAGAAMVSLSAAAQDPVAPPAHESAEFLTIGDPAPPLDVAHWIKGSAIDRFEPGRIYVISFWATWCKYCQAEMPALRDVEARFEPEDVTVAAISDEKLQTVFKFLAVPAWNDVTAFAVGADPDRSTQRDYMQAAAVGKIPTSFVVGRDGRIEWFGHPGELGSVVQSVCDGTWDRAAERERLDAEMAPARARFGQLREIRAAYEREDWPEVMRLFDRAIEESKYPADFKIQRFLLMIGEMNAPADGYSYGRVLLNEFWNDAKLLNNLAWFVVDGENVVERDLPFARKAAERACELTNHRDAAVLDTLARVFFEMGELDAAMKWQDQAVAALSTDSPFRDQILEAAETYRRAIRARDRERRPGS